MASKELNTDVVIVGAGLVGLSAAIALSKQGHQVVLVDPNKMVETIQKEWDSRIYALTKISMEWLASIGVWEHVDQARINSIDGMHLWSQKEDIQPAMKLAAEDANMAHMGCIVENQHLMLACWKAIKQTDVRVITEVSSEQLDNTQEQCILDLSNGQRVKAKLVIAADGVNSWVRNHLTIGVKLKPFNQTAIVANYSIEYEHGNIAKQWFGPHETLALLPMPNQKVSMVWALSTEEAQKQLSLVEADLTAKVAVRTKLSPGSLTPISKAMSFTLNQQTATRLIDQRVVLIGDAAHQIHPMAGQGVNLGFKDVMKLAEQTTNLSSLHDIGDQSVLRAYERAVKQEIFSLNTLTSGLDALFAWEHVALQKTIHQGMTTISVLPMIKKQLIKQATL